MGQEIPTQPLGRAASGEIVAKINGKHLQCNGTECPWMTTDTEQRTEDMKKLGRAVSFCVAFMVFEVVGGIQAGSLAILTDAAHLLSDVASFAISLFAMWAGGWEANLRQSYGFFRLEILGALVSIQIIWLITGIIVYEAFVRLVNEPVEIDGRLMFIIATLGLLVNLVMMFLLGHGHDHGHSHGSSNEHSHGQGHGHSHGSSNEHSRGHDHGHSHGSSNEHSPGHDHGHSHRSNNRITIEHKHTKHHNQLQSNHDHDEDPLRQPLLAEGHSDSHHHGKEHSHDHHDNAEQSPESPAQGKDFHHHHEDDQGHDDLNLRHQDRGDKVHRESDVIPGMVTYTGNGMDQSAGTVLEGHKTECVQENITKRSRSNDTIIVCICDQLENRSENDSSVRVIIDHGRDHHGEHDGSSHGSSINVRGAYLHVLGDLIQSIGVMVGGAIIWYKPEWKIVDLFCTFFFSIIVLGTTIKMIRDILEVLMESTPREVDAEALQSGLLAIEGVLEVHELHIWAITVGKVVLACHVMIKPDADSDDLLEKVIQYCDHKYKISHVTIQIERQKE